MTARSASLAALLLTVFLSAPAVRAQDIEGLPDDAPRSGLVVTIDLSTNHAYLFRDGTLVRKSPAATGSDEVLKKGRRVWWFRTPRGRLTVLRKIVDPVWHKPDWAFVEEGKPIPPADSPKRIMRGHLGKYALDLGERVMIHGTDDPSSIGRRVSHGCIRLPNAMLETLWKEVDVGTPVYIFESRPRDIAFSNGLNDLDVTREQLSADRK